MVSATGCECDPSTEGYCPRHRCFKIKKLRELCATDQRYFDQGERWEMPQQWEAGATACVHRGVTAIDARDCESCGKHVQVKIFACALHGRCAMAKEIGRAHV